MALGDKRRARKKRTLRVRRVVRRIELRSVLKLALLAHACCYGVTLGVGALLWKLALRYDLVHNIEKFMSDIGFAQDFRIDGPTLWRVVVRGGAILVVLNTVGTVLLAFFYNTVSGLFGGVVLSMLEEVPVVLRPGSPVPVRTPNPPVAIVDAKKESGRSDRRRSGPDSESTAPAERKVRRRDRKRSASLAPFGPTEAQEHDATVPLAPSFDAPAPVELDWNHALAPANGSPVHRDGPEIPAETGERPSSIPGG